MTKFDKDDRNLVNFLQQYRPHPPAKKIDIEKQIEEQIIELIEQDNLPDKHKAYQFSWAIPGAILAGLFIGWGSYRYSVTQPQLALNSDELEVFLVSSWQSGVGNNEIDDLSATMPADSLLITDRKAQLVLSLP
jgi:hypothetical protein